MVELVSEDFLALILYIYLYKYEWVGGLSLSGIMSKGLREE